MRAAAALRGESDEVRARNQVLEVQLRGVRGDNAASEAHALQCRSLAEEAAEALERERSHACELEKQSGLRLGELGRRIESFTLQLQSVRARGGQLGSEVSALYTAGSRVQALLLSEAPARGMASRSPSKPATPRRARRTSTPEGVPDMQRELAELRGWRREATHSLQRMADSLQAIQGGSERQRQYGHDLEAAVAQLGRLAKTTTSLVGPEALP